MPKINENKSIRLLWVLLGSLSVGMGVIGIFVPGWPTTIFLIIASYFIEGNTIEHIKSTNATGWIIVLYLALIMTALGYSIWYYVLGRYSVNKIMPVHLLLPITGVLTAILLLKERPDIQVFIGGLIILLGVGLILIGKDKKIDNKK